MIRLGIILTRWCFLVLGVLAIAVAARDDGRDIPALFWVGICALFLHVVFSAANTERADG